MQKLKRLLLVMITLFVVIVVTRYFKGRPINWGETIFYSIGFPILLSFFRWLFDYLLDPEAGRK